MMVFRRISIKVFPASLVVFCILPFIGKTEATACPSVRPAIYSSKNLNQIKRRDKKDPLVVNFLKEADKVCDYNPLSVVGKEYSYSDNPHDYCSIAIYSWPDDNNPEGPYVTKDGKVNPESVRYDRNKLIQFSERLQRLSIAYYITKDDVYYRAFVNNVESWFGDSLTYMSPNFEYAQVVKGLNDNKGQTYGLVELEYFTPIVESICLINSIRRLDGSLQNTLNVWFATMLNWVLNSTKWELLSNNNNNNIIAGCYVVLLEMARFTKNQALVKQLSKDYTERILNVQIDEEGKQPAELKRTVAYGYSVGNLRNIIDFALIMENSGVKYYKKNQKKIDSAFEYLIQFIDNHDSFPYQQTTSWEYYENQLNINASRLQRMSSRRSKMIYYSKQQSSGSITNILQYVY